MKPLAIDLFCGLGGWTDGLLAEGWDVIGFDIERHRYPRMIRPEMDEAQKCPVGGSPRNAEGKSVFKERPCHLRDTLKTATLIDGEWSEYPAQLVIQDVLTLHGSQFRNVDLIVASPPCQEFSYMAMPWSRAKKIADEYESGERDRGKLTALFDACFRIQREACQASGRHIPLIVENVRGAQRWVGRSRCNFGSFHLWGDVPALMPMTKALKVSGFRFDGSGGSFQTASVERHIKNEGGSWFNIAHNTTSGVGRNPVEALAAGIKNKDADGYERDHPAAFSSRKPRTSSKSPARKAASAMIAKIPLPLARYIGRTFYPLPAMAAD